MMLKGMPNRSWDARKSAMAESGRVQSADWTRPDSAIADFLASHERFGIPFNIMYSSAHPDGQVLPELLQMRGVTEALETAGISAK